MKKIGVLISGGGTNLQTVIDGVEKGYIPAVISIVISSRTDAYGLERARKHGIPTAIISRKDWKSDRDFSQALINELKRNQVELVVLAGYLSILSPEVVNEYKDRIINIHPSLIPSFCGKGYYGQKVHQAVLDYGAKVTGATVHFVDQGTDTGPIILQQSVEVKPDDNAESLGRRVLEIEHKLLPEAVKLWAEGRLTIEGRKVSINNRRGIQ